MDTSAAPPSPDTEPLIYKAAHLAFWLAGELRALLAAEPGKVLEQPFLRHVLHHYLLPAEAALRRAIHLLAAGLPPMRAPPRRFRPLPRAIPALHPVRRAPRPPVFCLSERTPAPPTDYIPEHLSPRIRIIGPPACALPVARPPARPPRTPVSLEDRLRRRCAALDTALKNPDAEARRLLRLRARLPAPRPLLRFARIPGYRSPIITESGRSALAAINAGLVARQLNTS